MTHITEEQFKNRFSSLILGARDLPKKTLDLHILFISATLNLDPHKGYSEAELNEQLHAWSDQFGGNFALDHVTLRRYLIDAGYLQRDAAGNVYQLNKHAAPFTFDDSLANIDLGKLVDDARREREERKRRYMKDSGR